MDYSFRKGNLKNFFDFLFIVKKGINENEKFFFLCKELSSNFLFYLKNYGERIFDKKVYFSDIDFSL